MSNNICIELGEIIRKTLTPLIKGDYILLDLPYYSNIGDILIWKGTETFLNELSGKCYGKHSKETFDFRPLPKDCTILLNGGGNFGDIWREHQEFRLEVMRVYPENDIIILPQTIFYENKDVLESDIEKMNQHKHLTICARDKDSSLLLKNNNFAGVLLTLPDMAFCIKQEELKEAMFHDGKGTLLLMRRDKELKTINDECFFKDISYEDWPDIEESGKEAWHFLMMHDDKESDSFFQNEYFPKRIEQGVQFASSYTDVYSTRLHVAILRLLLDLPVVMLDNSYGKNKSFFDTWLTNANHVSMSAPEESFKLNCLLTLQAQKISYEKIIADKETALCNFQNEEEELKRQLDEERYWLKVNKDWANSLLEEKEKLLEEKEKLKNHNTSLEKELQEKGKKVKKYKLLFKTCAILSIILLAILTVILTIR